MKKKLKFGTFESKKDAFIAYQKELDVYGRMEYLQKLRKAAYGKLMEKPNSNPKKIITFSIKENENLNEFLNRVFK